MESQLFVLRQELDGYDLYQRQIAAWDVETRKELQQMESKADPEKELGPRTRRKSHGHSALAFDLREDLYRVSGVDLTRIDGIDVVTAQTIISEVGVDMAAWPTEAPFCVVAGTLPGQSSKRGQSRQAWNAAGSEPDGDGAAHGCQLFIPKSELSGRSVPPLPNVERSAQSDHGDGAQTGETGVSTAALRARIRG